MILRDYKCMAHGYFESGKDQCPHGCTGSMIERVHLKAPTFGSERTKNLDKTIDHLAKEHGMTNFNNRGGMPAKVPDAFAVNKMERDAKEFGFQAGWGSLDKDTAIGQNLSAMNLQGGNALQNINLPKPIPNIVGRHDAKIEGST